MPTSPAATTALHEALLRRLTLAQCLRGRFDISEPGATLSLSGQKSDGKTIFFWEFDRPFRQLAVAYVAEVGDSQAAQLTILIDVVTETFQPSRTTHQQLAAAKKADDKRLIEERRAAPRDQTPYGATLAEQVATRLDQGATLAYSHRDYCGMGLSGNPQGGYVYGSVWDGYLEPGNVYPTRQAFVAWLAAQSDYSLAGLDSKDPWVWDNQTITRQRLEEFVQRQ